MHQNNQAFVVRRIEVPGRSVVVAQRVVQTRESQRTAQNIGTKISRSAHQIRNALASFGIDVEVDVPGTLLEKKYVQQSKEKEGIV